VGAGDITPMDYGECVKCMELYATLHSSQLKEELSALREENERLRKAVEEILRFKSSLLHLAVDARGLQYPDNCVKAFNDLESALHPSHNTEEK
jgi:hypothetical protein